MADSDAVGVVLVALEADVTDGEREAERLIAEGEKTARDLDRLEGELAALEAEVGSVAGAYTSGIQLPSRIMAVPEPCSWEERVAVASSRLRERGVDPLKVGVDDLLASDRIEEIERNYTNVSPIRTRLDRYDLLFAAASGVAATVVDALVVRIPLGMKWDGSWQKGSWLTSELRGMSIGADNWLARLAKVPFDRIVGYDEEIPGLTPYSHRVHTFGHDPLVGLLLGTLDIMRGTMTGVGRTGEIGVVDTPLIGVSNPFAALAIEVLHLLSDLPTKAGLPVPGWTIAMTMPVGKINGQAINEVAREMYLSGYDSWHLLTMSTVPATVELSLRAYWGIRRHLDDEFRTDVDRLADLAGTDTTGENPRFRSLAFAAHGVAAAGNIAKLATYGGNPLALNYAEWLAFFRAFFRWVRQALAATTTQQLIEHHAANRADLQRGWQQLAESRGVPALPWES